MSYTILGDSLSFSIANHQATREILIESDVFSTEAYSEILNDPTLPKEGDSHPTNPLLRAKSLILTPANDGVNNTIKLTVEYEKLGSPEEEKLPWLQKATYKVSSILQKHPVQVYYDENGAIHPNTNSAGDLLPEVDTLKSTRRLEIRTFAKTSPKNHDKLIGSLNKNNISILGRSGTGCFYMEDIQYQVKYYYSSQQTSLIPYYECIYIIQYAFDGFYLDQIDEGFRELDADQKLQEVSWLNSEGKKVQPLKPVKLNGTGQALSDTAQATPSEWCYVSGPRYFAELKVWNSLQLPVSEAV